MKTIYRYPVSVGANEILTYKNYQVLSAKIDPREDLSIWVLVDTAEDKTETLNVFVAGTGWDFPNMNTPVFVDTVRDGDYMWHVFYEGNNENIDKN